MEFKKDQIGFYYKSFLLTKVLEISELHCVLIELEHEPTGAKIIYLKNDDPENVFCLSFSTIPDSSNGVAHILEHTVLCGSEKFPVKDPFFSMTRRSLNTYMNALTGQDFTCYPAASQIKQDFYNLLDVYLDAVFHPKLFENSFYQEGHRLSFEVDDDPSTPLEYKGIVYNEMKGAMSSPSSKLHEALYAALFPDITYGLNSGGDPKEIPSLTYEELLAFHKKFYHPSRCLFYFYGSFPLEEHLDFIAERILNSADKQGELSSIPLQPRFEEPKKLTIEYSLSTESSHDNQVYVSFGWLTANILEQETLLALCILDIALMDTDASPLKMAFLKSGLCTQATSYVDAEITEAPFVINLKGCKAGSEDALEFLLLSTLKEIAEEGIPKKFIDHALHQLEFHRSEITGDHSPFGLILFMRSALLRQHGVPPEEGLMTHHLFERINRERNDNPRYFEILIEKYLLSNQHFVRVTMNPNPNLANEEAEKEVKLLEKIKSQLTEKELQEILKKTEELKAFQEEQDDENPDILPKITLDDVPKNSKDYPLVKAEVGNLQVFHHDCFTNSIVYADLTWDLPEIHYEDHWLIRLYAILIPQMGCADRSYVDNLEYIQAHLGGFQTSLSFNIQASDCSKFCPAFHIQGKALYTKADKLFSLICESVSSVDLSNRARIREIFFKHFTNLQANLTQSSLKYATSLVSSGINSFGRLNDQWFGLDYFTQIRKYAQDYEQLEDELIGKLYEIQKAVQPYSKPHLVIGCDLEMLSEIQIADFYGLTEIPLQVRKPFNINIPVSPVESQARLIASPVAFIAKAFNTISYSHPDSPALSIAANLLDNLSLHRLLREQGGAYGGGASFNNLSGNFLFYSYRDPNIASTFSAFEEAVDKVLKGEFDDVNLEEAKLEMIQGLDAPVSPGSRADVAYCWFKENKSYELIQKYRRALLSVNKKDIIDALKTHVLPNMKNSTSVVFAGKDLVEKENILLEASHFPKFPILKI